MASSFHIIGYSISSRSTIGVRSLSPSKTGFHHNWIGSGRGVKVLLVQNTSKNEYDSTAKVNDAIASLAILTDRENELKGKLQQPDELTLTANPSQRTPSSKLSCKILGFYPFPSPPPKGPLGWLFKDTHQAIMVTLTSNYYDKDGANKVRKTKVLMDFMTKGGASHPVWYDEIVKWQVFLGGSIEGEVRMKVLGAKQRRAQNDNIIHLETGTNHCIDLDFQKSSDEMNNDDYGLDVSSTPSLERLMKYANTYNCEMNLYGNNCRMFAARMEREVERINMNYYGDNDNCGDYDNDIIISTLGSVGDKDWSNMNDAVAINMRCLLRILGAALLPALYPLGALLLLYKGYWLA
jgi:hypothetical protein